MRKRGDEEGPSNPLYDGSPLFCPSRRNGGRWTGSRRGISRSCTSSSVNR